MAVKKKKKRRARRILFCLIVTVAVLVLLGCTTMIFIGFIDKPFLDVVDSNGEDTDAQNNDPELDVTQVSDQFSNMHKQAKQYTFLIAGVDRGSSLTDVLLLVKYDMTAGTMNILQIPRDTYVNNKHSSKKINAVNAYGGIDELRETVADMFGVEVDRYILMDLNGFSEIVDILDGIEMDVPEDMNYDDPYQDPELHIHLKEGPQVLDGDQAEQFVRFRHGYATGDLGRVEAQKLFLQAFANKFFSATNIFKIPSLASAFMDNIETDLSLQEMVYFAKSALKLSTSNMTVFTVPGESFNKNASYFGAYEDETLAIMNQYFSPYAEQITDLDIYSFERKLTESATGSTGTPLSEIGKVESTESSSQTSSSGTTTESN